MKVKYEWVIYSTEKKSGKSIRTIETRFNSFHDEEEIKSYINRKNKELKDNNQNKKLSYEAQFFIIGPGKKKYKIKTKLMA